jgi:hypothetical protein
VPAILNAKLLHATQEFAVRSTVPPCRGDKPCSCNLIAASFQIKQGLSKDAVPCQSSS